MWKEIKSKLPIVCVSVVIGCLFYFNYQTDSQLKDRIDRLEQKLRNKIARLILPSNNYQISSGADIGSDTKIPFVGPFPLPNEKALSISFILQYWQKDPRILAEIPKNTSIWMEATNNKKLRKETPTKTRTHSTNSYISVYKIFGF